ncbi:unnamed protein product [Mesocestoides corti]|uniref:peptidyl-tRNA hydrolase n=1 Tax=Mesocestoides corti TaxID=53468 RepID=A0A0R3UJX1_MESCO|nr:unnamed protein product [Mesocestoides corti]
MMSTSLVQYILVRTDLKTSLAWPLGAIIAQACHASTAALHKFASHEQTQAYLADLDNMHKVVLGIDDEPKLAQFSVQLEAEDIDFVLWREQPENILTALALRPYIKKDVCHLLKQFPLVK